MSSLAASIGFPAEEGLRAGAASNSELLLASRPVAGGLLRTELSVPGVHCAGCIRKVETALSRLDGVEYARVNLSTHRAAVHWQPASAPPPMLEALERLGYKAHLFEAPAVHEDKEMGRLIRALAVAQSTGRSLSSWRHRPICNRGHRTTWPTV